MSKQVIKLSLGTIVLMALGGAALILIVFSAAEEITEPVYRTSQSVALDLTAKAWEVFDLESGEVLYNRNPDQVLPIASITKLLTASELLKLDSLANTTTIVWSDINTEGRAGKLQYGEEYTNRELLFPLLLESSNDAASALLRVHPSLLEEMNNGLSELELVHTSLADVSGLSDKNLSTAHELSLIARYLYQTQPHVFDITQLSAYYSDENGWVNNSPFILDEDYRGGKHGFTYAANRTAVAFFEEELASGTDRTIGYVLLGSDDLASDMQVLREFVTGNTSYR